MESIRIAFVGDSHPRRLTEQWLAVLPTDKTNVEVQFFGFGGEKLGGESFCNRYIQSIVKFRPHKVFIWIGGNDLEQDLRYVQYNR